MGKYFVLVAYTCTPCSCTVALYYTCNIIRDKNLWFSKCAWKLNLFCDNCYKKLLMETKLRKFTFLKYSRTVTASLKKFSSNTIFRLFTLRKFYMVKFDLVKDLIKWKRGFEIFLIDQCACGIGNKKVAVM